MKKLTSTVIWGNANPNNENGYGLPASGDSGSPFFVNGRIAEEDPSSRYDGRKPEQDRAKPQHDSDNRLSALSTH